MSHRLRISASKKLDIIEHSLAEYEDMKAHLETCTICNDEAGICESGQEIWSRVKEAQGRLRQIGFEQ
jgi:hypothetical protein